MGKNQSASGLTNIIQYDNKGNVSFVSGSTTLMQISSSGAITTTGVISGSNALSSSYALNSGLLNSTGSVGFATTASLLTVSSSQQQISASQQQMSASLLQVSASYIALSGSYNTYSSSVSTRTTQIENVYATTGSNSFRATQSITGSLTVTGQIIAQTINVQQVTSSIVYSSGSNVFGCDLNSRQTFTGSVLITGSLNTAGTITGTTIYGSTAVCSPVGKFTTCLDLGGALTGTSATFSGNGAFGTTTLLSGGGAASWLTLNGTVSYGGGIISSVGAVAKAYYYFDGTYAALQGTTGIGVALQYNGGTNALTINGSTGAACFACCITAPGLQINSPTYVPLVINSSYGQVGANFSLNGTTFGGMGSANNFSSDAGIAATDMGIGTNGTSTGKIVFATGTGYTTRMIITSAGIACFSSTVCAAGHVSSEDVRIYRSAGATTGYINFGSTGTNYLGFDGTRFSINGSINAGGATFSDVGDTCLVLRTTNSANPRFKFCGGSGVFNRSTAADVMYFGESADTGLYLFRGGTLMSDKGACTGTYGFTHCGSGKWGRIGLPNASYMYLETNANAGVYVDAALQIGGNVCSSGQVKGTNLNAAGPICGSGFRSGASSANSGGYTSDGLWGATATPNYIDTTSSMGLRLGYTDNGSGLYGAAYGFDVSYKDGLNNCIDYNAIIMRNSGQGTTPFRVTSYGNIYGTSKNFRIKHPIPSMNNTHYLIHTSIEGPQADLIYRGKVQLVNGKAEVNIDLASRMTDGTFEALCQDVQSYTTNESGWSLTKSYVVENILHIEAQDETSDDTISWLVIGERNDDGIKNSAITDENGHVIVEELKPEEGL